MADDIVTRAIAGNWDSAKIVVPPDTPHTFQGKEFYEPMTDDIVTRLREYDCLRDGDYPEVWMREAADEIERLRLDLENVRDLNNNLMKELQTYYG